MQDEIIEKEKLATIGKITGMVAHELRNPMGTIKNSLHSLRSKVIDEETETYMKRIERNVSRCDNIINELLSYATNSVLSKEYVSLNKLISNVLLELNLKDIQIQKSVNDIDVYVDVHKFERIFINILQNSIESFDNTNKDEKKINILAQKNKFYTIIEIESNGPNISKEVLDKMYTPLFSTKNYGIGLGLSVVKKYIEEHNGTVKTENTKFGVKTTINILEESNV